MVVAVASFAALGEDCQTDFQQLIALYNLQEVCTPLRDALGTYKFSQGEARVSAGHREESRVPAKLCGLQGSKLEPGRPR